MRQDEPTRPVRIPRLRTAPLHVEQATLPEEEFEARAAQARQAIDRETERFPKADGTANAEE